MQNSLESKTNIADYLYDVFKEKCLVKSQVFRKAEVDEIFGYQIFVRSAPAFVQISFAKEFFMIEWACSEVNYFEQ